MTSSVKFKNVSRRDSGDCAFRARADRCMTLEGELVEFARGLRWNELPLAVREAVSRLTGDALANAVSGRTAADVPALEAASRALYGEGTSSVIVGGLTSLVGAVGLNAFQTTANTMCDVYRPGLCHVTPEVVPAALGIVERYDTDGEGFLTAVAAGMEVTTRICQAMNYPAFRARGWHSPGISGAMGASVTAGLLSGFDHDTLAGCLGLAGSQAGGTFAAMGTMAVKFHQLRGAQSAVIAAVHANEGLVGSPQVLTAKDGGLLRAFSDDPQPLKLTEGLGTVWSLLDIGMRSYPAASTLQSLISVLLSARAVLDLDNISSLSIELPPEAYRLGGEAGWESELRSMQSARYVAAAVTVTRTCWTDLFSDARRHDPVIDAFAREKVTVIRRAELSEGAVRVTVATSSGQQIFECDVPPGDPDNPMTPELLLEKARRCVAGSVLEERSFDVSRLLNLSGEVRVASLLKDLRAH
jgi:2-methylcitrate dehydratase PrpD